MKSKLDIERSEICLHPAVFNTYNQTKILYVILSEVELPRSEITERKREAVAEAGSRLESW